MTAGGLSTSPGAPCLPVRSSTLREAGGSLHGRNARPVDGQAARWSMRTWALCTFQSHESTKALPIAEIQPSFGQHRADVEQGPTWASRASREHR